MTRDEYEVARKRLNYLMNLRNRIDREADQLSVRLARVEFAFTPTGKRSRKVIPACGTESAYQRHRYLRETADDECLAAHAAHERVRVRRSQRLAS